MLIETYRAAAIQLSIAGDKGYCGPLALALILDRDPEEVSRDLSARSLRRFKQGMTTYNILRYLDLNNVKHEIVKDIPSCTMSTVGRRFPKGKFLVFIRGHVAAMIDGEVLDWTAGRRHGVLRIERIIEDKIAPEVVAPKKAANVGKQSKSMLMLARLRELDGCMSLDNIIRELDTSEASVRCYVSYFRNGSRGHEQIAMRIVGRVIILGA